MKVPRQLDSQIARQHFFRSSQPGSRTAPSLATETLWRSCAACSSSSVSANRPISTGMNSMPSVNE
jgi:hypothetical protein